MTKLEEKLLAQIRARLEGLDVRASDKLAALLPALRKLTEGYAALGAAAKKMSAIREGQKCMLRADMLATYYKHREEKTIRQYEYENYLYEYKAYKALRGNSFIDRIAQEIAGWEIVT